MAAAVNSDDAEEVNIYMKTASRLTNLLSVKGDYEGALKVAVPVAEKMKALGNDTTGDYYNLLMFIGCNQTRFGKFEEAKRECIEPAYEGHLKRIEQNRSDAAYKDFITCVINVTYNFMVTGRYEDALEWDDRFLAILQQYGSHTPKPPTWTSRKPDCTSIGLPSLKAWVEPRRPARLIRPSLQRASARQRRAASMPAIT